MRLFSIKIVNIGNWKRKGSKSILVDNFIDSQDAKQLNYKVCYYMLNRISVDFCRVLIINIKSQNDMASEIQSSGSDQNKESSEKDFLQNHFAQILDRHQQLLPEKAFHLEYCKLYIKNINLTSEIDQTKLAVHNLRQQVYSSNGHKQFLGNPLPNPIRHPNNANIHHSNDSSNSEKRRRIRRNASQIARHYVCQVQQCQKSYGSEGSLNQHIKLKHKELLTRDKEGPF